MKIKIKEQRNPKTRKPVTVVSGITHNPQEIEKIERNLKKICGSGGYNEKKVIYIQGSHSSKVKSFLEKEGYIVTIG